MIRSNLLTQFILIMMVGTVLMGCKKLDFPSGKIILMEENIKGERNIIEMDTNGRNKKIITKLPPSNLNRIVSRIIDIDISFNKEKVVFNIYKIDEKSSYIKIKEANLFLMDISKKKIIKLTEDYIDETPSFSSDGEKIIFSSTNRDGTNTEIYEMNLNEVKNIRRLTCTSFLDEIKPKYSPSMKRIVFEASTHIHEEIPYFYFSSDENAPVNKKYNSSEIYIMDSDGKNVYRLTNDLLPSKVPVWSPDEKKIAFFENKELCVMDADGKNKISLRKGGIVDKRDGYLCGPVCWSPDGKYISLIFRYWRKGYKIFIINTENTENKNVTKAINCNNKSSSSVLIKWLP